MPSLDEVEGQSIRFNISSWGPAFPDGPVAEVLASHPEGRIRRGDVLQAARRARENAWAETATLYAVAAAMVWGVGSGNAGRGFTWSRNLFAADDVDDVLSRVVQDLETYDVAGAYRAAVGFSGVQEPFFTKILYALGTAIECRPQPLTLDKRVRDSLAGIGYVYGRRRQLKAVQYANWLTDMQAWADELECRPDQIELWLFSQ